MDSEGPQSTAYNPGTIGHAAQLARAEVADRPPSAYETALLELDSEIGQCLELFTDLTQRIAPVIRDEPSKDGLQNGEAVASYPTRVARELQERTARVRQLRLAIRNVGRLVDL